MFSQYKSKPNWFSSFFWGLRQDKALFKNVEICSLSLFVLSEMEGLGIVCMLLVDQSESALIFTHDFVSVFNIVISLPLTRNMRCDLNTKGMRRGGVGWSY